MILDSVSNAFKCIKHAYGDALCEMGSVGKASTLCDSTNTLKNVRYKLPGYRNDEQVDRHSAVKKSDNNSKTD